MAHRYIAVAEVARPHGIKGELKLQVFNPESDLLLRRPQIRLRFADGTERDASITGARSANKAVLVTLAGVSGRDEAEALRGAQICVRRDLFPEAEEGEFYACDLEGAEVVLLSGERVGRVRTTVRYPSCDALVVDPAGGGAPIEVPLVEDYVDSIDADAGRVVLSSVAGLG